MEANNPFLNESSDKDDNEIIDNPVDSLDFSNGNDRHAPTVLENISEEEQTGQDLHTVNLAEILAYSPNGETDIDSQVRNVTSPKNKDSRDQQTKSKASFLSKTKSRFGIKLTPKITAHDKGKAMLHEKEENIPDEPEGCRETEEEDTTKETQGEQVEAAVVDTVDESNNIDEEEVLQSKSSIVRGVPKVTKPAPPVVAIKMADLIGDTPENEPVEQSKSCEESHLDNVKDTKPPVEDKKLKKELEKKERKEKERLEKETKLEEKKKKTEEAKLKKEQEKLKKQQEKQAKDEEKQRLKKEKQKKKEEKEANKKASKTDQPDSIPGIEKLT